MFDEFKAIKSSPKELKEFGVVVGAILIIIGDVAMLRHRGYYPYLISIGSLFVLLGLVKPSILLPLQKFWMGLGIFIGFFVSRIILSVLFFGVMTPIGFLMKLFGKDILDEKMDRSTGSYWNSWHAATRTKESYENQY